MCAESGKVDARHYQLPAHPVASNRLRHWVLAMITTAPGPSAVLMAVSNAIGKRIFDYPVTPDKVLTALGKIKGGKA